MPGLGRRFPARRVPRYLRFSERGHADSAFAAGLRTRSAPNPDRQSAPEQAQGRSWKGPANGLRTSGALPMRIHQGPGPRENHAQEESGQNHHRPRAGGDAPRRRKNPSRHRIRKPSPRPRQHRRHPAAQGAAARGQPPQHQPPRQRQIQRQPHPGSACRSANRRTCRVERGRPVEDLHRRRTRGRAPG